MRVTRTLYEKSPRRGYAVILGASYDGPGLRRRETLMYEREGRDDLPFTPRERTSEDNGRTWTDWKALPEAVAHEENRWDLFGLSPVDSDPATGLTLGVGLRQTIVERPVRRWYNHAYWALSSDGGRTWGEPRQFRYEEGSVRDPANPLDPAFLEKNRAYPGGAIRLSDGSVLLACTAVNVPDDAPDTDPTGEFTGWDKAPHARDIGACCFRGRWDRRRRGVADEQPGLGPPVRQLPRPRRGDAGRARRRADPRGLPGHGNARDPGTQVVHPLGRRRHHPRARSGSSATTTAAGSPHPRASTASSGTA